MPDEIVPILLSLAAKIIPESINILFTDALNMRLGTWGLTIEQVAALAAEREMEIQDLMA